MAEIIIGLVSGIVSGTGMGGGTILIFLLTYISGLEQHIAQATNLIFFIPTSIVAIIVNIKNKNIRFRVATMISVFGILGAIIGANLSIHPNVYKLKKLFGIFLAIIAIHEIYTIIKENKKIQKGDNKIKLRKNIKWLWTEKMKDRMNMKFTKGLLMGGLLATGIIMMYNDTDILNKNKMMKKGKKFVKKMGIL